MVKQTEKFIKESFRYVNTYLYNDIDENFLKFEKVFEDFHPQEILDVGCGNGNGLHALVERFNCEGVGVEPSIDAIKLLSDKFEKNNRLKFASASAHSLPFENDSFDLVYTWSVLHWVGRNEYLQALGELVRVTKKYLIVMDFVASENYRVKYHHEEGLYTFKVDFELPLLSSGLLEKIYEKRWWINPQNGNKETIDENDLKPFQKNILNYHSRKMVVFKKNYDQLRILSEENFK